MYTESANAVCSHLHHDTHYTPQKTMVIKVIMILLGTSLLLNSFIIGILTDDKGISSLSAMVGALILGFPLIFEAFSQLWHGIIHMNELAALAIVACFALGDYKTAGIVSFFMVVGEIFQHRTALGARQAIESLIRLTPSIAHKLKDNQVVDVKVSELKVGDLIKVLPGENFPVDGIIKEGQTTINEASITGESLPIDKGTRDRVFAGTENLTGAVVVEVTHIGEDTTIGKVKELILQAEKTKLPIMQIIDQYIGWYTPVILMIAGLILFFTKDTYRAITVLIVACPCSILLATPTAMVAALSCAAKLGILIKNISNLEIAGKINTFIFDKTGTLTTGQLEVVKLAPLATVEPHEFLKLCASAEQNSNHPVAKAINNVAKKANMTLLKVSEFIEIPGKGIKCKIENKDFIVGKKEFLEENGIHIPEDLPGIKKYTSSILLYVGYDRKYIGWIALQDMIREESKEVIMELKSLGAEQVVMLTGDRPQISYQVGDKLGFTAVYPQCLPETKLEIVKKYTTKGKVAVVGDGINDAPALASGDIGIAMGALGNDVAINSASIALMHADLRGIPKLVRLSRLTRKIIYENLGFALIFTIVGLSLSGMGYLTPVVAAILHNVSAFTVIFNSARIVRFAEG